MYSADSFRIDLKELTAEYTAKQFVLDDAYFKAIEAPDIQKGHLTCELNIRKTESFFELNFRTDGVVQIPCDLCLDEMDQPIHTEDRLVVKFGEEYSEDDDLVTIDENEGVLDISWFIYEFIVLNIPIKHVHAPGHCNAEMIKLLEEHTATRSDGEDDEKPIDPRWSKLADLIDKN